MKTLKMKIFCFLIVLMFNMDAQQIYKQDLNVSANLNLSLDINTKSYSDGAYNVIISNSGGEIMNGKFIKIK